MASFPTVVDSSESVEPILERLHAEGVRAVFRYYALEKQPELPSKIVTPRERDAIFDAGLSLGIAFQFHNDKITTFTPDRGAKDAAKALDYGGGAIQQQHGSAIYFGVDGDFSSPAELDAVRSYFDAVNHAFVHAGSPFEIGVYGSGLSCETLASSGLATKFWLAKSTRYPGTQRFYNQRRWHLYQNMLEVPIGAGAVDTNWLNSGANGPGTFDRHGPTAPAEPAAVVAERRFVTQEADLFTQPDQGSRRSGTLHARENVVVVQEQGDWARVRVRENATLDLYVRSERLRPIERMP